jgi:hypothetical protein
MKITNYLFNFEIGTGGERKERKWRNLSRFRRTSRTGTHCRLEPEEVKYENFCTLEI